MDLYYAIGLWRKEKLTRTEKFKELHKQLKAESDDIRFILEADKQDYTELFDEMMGNPMQQLEDMLPRVYRKEDMLCR